MNSITFQVQEVFKIYGNSYHLMVDIEYRSQRIFIFS